MQRILPQSDLERKLLCLGAVFIEEYQLLDELFDRVGDVIEESEEDVLSDMDEIFFRLDMNFGSDADLEVTKVLDEAWGIKHKKDVHFRLKEICNQGHRTKFNSLKSSVPIQGAINDSALKKFEEIFKFDLEDNYDLKMTAQEYLQLAQWIQKTHGYLPESGILAWDLARYVHLVRLSFIGGLLNSDEAWFELSKVSSLTEGKFENWLEFAQSFLIGRTFWSGSDDPRVKGVCERLLGHPASPWLIFKW